MPTLYSSGHLLYLARRGHERSVTDASESRVAVIMAAVALEAFVNELQHVALSELADFSDAVKNMGQALAAAEDEHASVGLRIQVAHLALTGTLPDKGGQPFQDLTLLLKLRNLLVHARPEEVEFGQQDRPTGFPKIVRSFASRGVIAAPLPGQPLAWEQYVLVPSVAAWAHNTCARAMQWLVNLSDDAVKGLYATRRIEEIAVP